jgi:hypothetical protein
MNIRAALPIFTWRNLLTRGGLGFAAGLIAILLVRICMRFALGELFTFFIGAVWMWSVMALPIIWNHWAGKRAASSI